MAQPANRPWAQATAKSRWRNKGSGKIGFLKGVGLMNLKSVDAATEVAYEGDVQVGGTIAAVGQRLVDTTSKMMIKRFFDRIAEELKGSSGPV